MSVTVLTKIHVQVCVSSEAGPPILMPMKVHGCFVSADFCVVIRASCHSVFIS